MANIMSKKEFEEFEIIDRYGARWRYKRHEGFFWSWTDDREESVAVLRYCSGTDDGEEYDEVARFPLIAMVGDVTPNTCLNLNLRPQADSMRAMSNEEMARRQFKAAEGWALK
jgi:hypothetical protein